MKLEYGNFYKFVTSLGIVLVCIACLIPWLFLQAPYDLFLEQEEIELLTGSAQVIINIRQMLTGAILIFLPVVSLILFAVGVFVLVLGGERWFTKTQLAEDRLRELEEKKLKKDLEDGTNAAQDDRDADIEDHIDGVPDELRDLERQDIPRWQASAYNAHRAFVDRLNQCYHSTHEIQSERRLGAVAFDAVLIANRGTSRDYVFEVKYIRKDYHYGWLRDNTMKIIYAAQAYTSGRKRHAVPVLVVIHAKDSLGMENGKLTSRIRGYPDRIHRKLRGIDPRAIVIQLPEAEMRRMSCAEIRSMIDDEPYTSV